MRQPRYPSPMSPYRLRKVIFLAGNICPLSSYSAPFLLRRELRTVVTAS
jgi:hypothetical protein